MTNHAIRLCAEGWLCASTGHQIKANAETVRQHLLAAGMTLPGRLRRRPTPVSEVGELGPATR
jgi:hypothetical protein